MFDEKKQAQLIHDASMRILATTGVRFVHPDALTLLEANGVRLEGEIAYFTEDQIMEWVGKAPSHAPVFARNSRFDVNFGDDKTYCGPAANAVFIMEPDGTTRASTFEDYVKVMKLYEGYDGCQVTGGAPVHPSDIPVETSSLVLQYSGFRLSNKAMYSATDDYAQMEAVMSLTAAAFGETTEDLKKHPRTFTIANVNSPLLFDHNMTETLFTFGKYHQPVAISSAAMGGATAPITVAGAIAQVNAEVISVVALSQMNEPGAPVLYGSQSGNSDMKTLSMAIGSPEAALFYKYCAIMARFYGIPSRGGGVLSDAKAFDPQCGYESMLTYFACRENDVNLVMQCAGILDSYLSFSLEKCVADFEIIDFANRYADDIEIDEETLAEDVIEEVGHSGSFVDTDHTLDNYLDVLYNPVLAVRGNVPADSFMKNCARQIQTYVDKFKAPELPAENIEAMQQVMHEFGIDDDLIAWVDSHIDGTFNNNVEA